MAAIKCIWDPFPVVNLAIFDGFSKHHSFKLNGKSNSISFYIVGAGNNRGYCPKDRVLHNKVWPRLSNIHLRGFFGTGCKSRSQGIFLVSFTSVKSRNASGCGARQSQTWPWEGAEAWKRAWLSNGLLWLWTAWCKNSLNWPLNIQGHGTYIGYNSDVQQALGQKFDIFVFIFAELKKLMGREQKYI